VSFQKSPGSDPRSVPYKVHEMCKTKQRSVPF
jgi:hypothetical protein